MTLKLQGIVEFERDAEGNPIEGTDGFRPAFDRDDYRPLPGVGPWRPTHLVHVEDGYTYPYVDLVPVRPQVTRLLEARP
jgi:hypothetical protein